MDTRNCRMCGRLFNYIRSPFCQACTEKLEEKFKQVKDYIYEHPGAGLAEVSEENEVSQSTIQHWVREERLSFSEDSQVTFACEKCGIPIRTGRFCKRCKDKMKQEFSKLYYVEPEKKEKKGTSTAKMRFLGHENEL